MWLKENPARFREGVPGQGFRDGIAFLKGHFKIPTISRCRLREK
jgi:hypothetical protein